jgi:hypothetical protein
MVSRECPVNPLERKVPTPTDLSTLGHGPCGPFHPLPPSPENLIVHIRLLRPMTARSTTTGRRSRPRGPAPLRLGLGPDRPRRHHHLLFRRNGQPANSPSTCAGHPRRLRLRSRQPPSCGPRTLASARDRPPRRRASAPAAGSSKPPSRSCTGSAGIAAQTSANPSAPSDAPPSADVAARPDFTPERDQALDIAGSTQAV